MTMEAKLKSELLEKAKLTLSLDCDDTSQDSYLEFLIDAEFNIALERTGKAEADINEAIKESVVRNVGIKFDDMEGKRDLDVYFNFNEAPMI